MPTEWTRRQFLAVSGLATLPVLAPGLLKRPKPPRPRLAPARLAAGTGTAFNAIVHVTGSGSGLYSNIYAATY